MKGIAATLVVVLLVTVLFSGCLGSNDVQGFSASDLKKPSSNVANTSAPQSPENMTVVYAEFKGYTIKYSLSETYEDYGGILLLQVQNDQISEMFVYGFGLKWTSSGVSYLTDSSVYIAPGEIADLGLLAYGAPSSTGLYAYEIIIKVAAQDPVTHVWKDYGSSSPESKYLTVLPKFSEDNYTTTSNDRTSYNMINARVDFDLVAGIASSVQTKEPGKYSVLHIVEAYQWVIDNIEYKADAGDYWQTVQETLDLRTGDCEDQAILMTSIITALGGSARVNLIEDHAFPTVFIGTSQSEVIAANNVIRSYYGLTGNQLHICYLHDDLGYWLVIDTTGFPYAGGLPAKAAPTISSAPDAWGFESTTYLIKVDVTGHQAAGSWVCGFIIQRVSL